MKRAAIRIYWYASVLAVAEALLLFSIGLDLRPDQVSTLLLIGFPAPIVMYLVDRWLILRHVAPIDAVLPQLETGKELGPTQLRAAWVQALNLPTLTLLRVLTVHAPAVLLPATALVALANSLTGLGLVWWQFLVIWLLWPITAVPHAIVEYFLIDRLVAQTLGRLESVGGEALNTPPPPRASARATLRLLWGKPLAAPRIIRTSAATQLAWLFFFVSLMPVAVLGASTYLKLAALRAVPAQLLRPIGLWMATLIALNAAVSLAIVALASQRIRRSMETILRTMRQILRGDLSGHWSPRTTDEFLDLGAGCNAMLLGLREREQIKDTFGRFVSWEVAEAVLAGRVPLHGEMREITVLFQDIRGFTTMSEKTPPDQLLRMLNEFFTEIVAAVEAHGGVVNQFTGDGVMALFGAPGIQPHHPAQAVRAGIDMLARLESFNRRRAAQGAPALRIGVGIHTGEVVAGCIGPDTRREYSVVGDTVNLASRVQDLTKQLGVALLVTGQTAAWLGREFAFGKEATLPVRGKEHPVRVIEVLSSQTQA